MPRHIPEGPQDYGKIEVFQVGQAEIFYFNPRVPESERCTGWSHQSDGLIVRHGGSFTWYPNSVLLKVKVTLNGPDARAEHRDAQAARVQERLAQV